MLEREYKYYENHKKEFDSKYDNNFIVIVGDNIVGVYNNQREALEETLKNHKAGTFLLQKCLKDEDQIQRFYSRVSFSEI